MYIYVLNVIKKINETNLHFSTYLKDLPPIRQHKNILKIKRKIIF